MAMLLYTYCQWPKHYWFSIWAIPLVGWVFRLELLNPAFWYCVPHMYIIKYSVFFQVNLCIPSYYSFYLYAPLIQYRAIFKRVLALLLLQLGFKFVHHFSIHLHTKKKRKIWKTTYDPCLLNCLDRRLVHKCRI